MSGAVGLIWGLIGMVVLADLLLSAGRGVGLEVEAPKALAIGEGAVLRLHLSAPARPIRLRFDWPMGLSGPGEIVLEAGAHRALAEVPIRAVRRGTWALGGVWLNWPSRLGFFEWVPHRSLEHAIPVFPDIRLAQSGQIDVMVRSALFGLKDALVTGDGAEFHQLRDFSPGMDTRSIDWKRSARHRSLVAREMRAERNHHVILALDCGHLMREEIAGLPKIDHAINAALATGWAAILGGDLIGLYAFDARPRLFTPPQAGRSAFARIRLETAELVYASVETNHTLALAELNQRTPRRSLIVVFSDFVDTTTAELLTETLGVLTRRHAIIFVALRDPALAPALAPHGGLPSLDDVARAVALAQMQRERQIVMERLARLGITVIDSTPERLSVRLISAYLDLKARDVL